MKKNDKVQHLRNEPKLRFNDFRDPYSIHKLGAVATFSKGKGISKSDIVDGGKLQCIRYGELYTRYDEKITEIHSKTNETDVVLSEKYDVITPSSGETAIDLATASCIMKQGVALGGDINIIRTNQHGLYLSYYLNSNKKYDFAKLGQGNSIVHIYNSHLKDLKLKLPEFDEQHKVANFIDTIDSKINLLENKLENLKLFKKGFIRTSIYEIKEKFNIESLKFSVIQKTKGQNPNYTDNKGNLLLSNQYLQDGKTIQYVSNTNDVKYHDVLVLWDGSNAGNSYTDVKGVCGSTFVKLELKTNKLNNSYLVKNIMNDINKIKSVREGSGIPHMPRDFLTYYKLSIPPIEQQEELVKTYQLLDTKILLTSDKIDELKQFKKGLLQKMFV